MLYKKSSDALDNLFKKVETGEEISDEIQHEIILWNKIIEWSLKKLENNKEKNNKGENNRRFTWAQDVLPMMIPKQAEARVEVFLRNKEMRRKNI